MATNGSQPKYGSWSGLFKRSLTEFFVIIAGVLVALAADRWNQRRVLTATEDAYLQRQRVRTALENAERRGRDPYMEALYPLGLIPYENRLPRAQEFVEWPGMAGLLLGLEGYFTLLGGYVPALEAAAGEALLALRR